MDLSAQPEEQSLTILKHIGAGRIESSVGYAYKLWEEDSSIHIHHSNLFHEVANTRIRLDAREIKLQPTDSYLLRSSCWYASYPFIHSVHCDHARIEKDDAFADAHALQHPHLVYSHITVDVPSPA